MRKFCKAKFLTLQLFNLSTKDHPIFELTRQDEVITYGTRGFEPTRGFPQFMEAVEKLLKTRPNAHVLIAGENKVHYGSQKKIDYKELILLCFHGLF